jgi:hypothetical protein
MSGKKSRNEEKAAGPRNESIQAKPRIVPAAPTVVPEKGQEAIHQPGIIFSGLQEKLSSEELLKRMQ